VQPPGPLPLLLGLLTGGGGPCPPRAGLASEKLAQGQELAAATELEALLWKAGRIAEQAGVRWAPACRSCCA
jgi:hypothetical protein